MKMLIDFSQSVLSGSNSHKKWVLAFAGILLWSVGFLPLLPNTTYPQDMGKPKPLSMPKPPPEPPEERHLREPLKPAAAAGPSRARRRSALESVGASGRPSTVDLFIATEEGDAASLRYVLRSGADPDARNARGLTPLMIASMSRNTAVMNILLHNGANVNAKASSEVEDASVLHEGDGYTSLMIAAWLADSNGVHLLLENGADVNEKGKDGRTPLMLAAYQANSKIVDELLAKGSDVDAKDNDGSTALIGASFNGHRRMVMALLKKRADVNAKDNIGGTALMAAAGNGHIGIVKALLCKRADVNARNRDGLSALKFAEENERFDVVVLLRKAGAKRF